MTDNPDRRRLIQCSLAALPALLALDGAYATAPQDTARQTRRNAGPEHDFDFFLGTWRVQHRRLKQRLANNNEWEEFDGTTHCQSLLGGIANLNDSVVNRAGGSYRGMGLRAYDAKTMRWADWYLDGRNPTQIGAPGVGHFENGIGTFLSEDTFQGRPVIVRGMFSAPAPDKAQWEQAFSPDGGTTWETNWVMRYTRIR